MTVDQPSQPASSSLDYPYDTITGMQAEVWESQMKLAPSYSSAYPAVAASILRGITDGGRGGGKARRSKGKGRKGNETPNQLSLNRTVFKLYTL